MPYCGKCGAELRENAVFCPKCGNKQDTANDVSEKPEYYTSPTYERDSFPHTAVGRKRNNSVIILAVVIGAVALAVLAAFVYFKVYRPDSDMGRNISEQAENNTSMYESYFPQENVTGSSIPISPSIDDVYNGYLNAFEEFLPIEAVLPRDLHYGVYDIDKDGIPELIVEDYYYATESTYHIYTYDSGKVSYIGNYPGVHSSLYEYNGKGLVYFSAMGGYGVIRLLTISGGELLVADSVDVTPANYREPGDVFAGAESMIELNSYSDSMYSYDTYIYYDIADKMSPGRV